MHVLFRTFELGFTLGISNFKFKFQTLLVRV